MDQQTMDRPNPREAAYLAALYSWREEGFASDWLERWRIRTAPPSADYALARELAYGTIRMRLSLDYLAQQLAERQKLDLKIRERLLVHLGIYQKYYMSKIPDHALVYETVNVAKKYCHMYFIKFLNALLRNLVDDRKKITLPEGDSSYELSIRCSYPESYIQQLVLERGLASAKEIMAIGNEPSSTMLRLRTDSLPQGVRILPEIEPPMGQLLNPSLLPALAASSDYYFQNATPVLLMAGLIKGMKSPKRIADLCAAPGGKLLFLHDHYRDAQLFANDLSESRLQSVAENCKKYKINATLSCGPGEEFQNSHLFDLVVLDVPCSNSGVLNKRPEARWRLSTQALKQLQEIQTRLIKHAVALLAPGGEIWYLTCSILNQENGMLIAPLCKELGFSIRQEKTIFPNREGWDGGYAAALRA